MRARALNEALDFLKKKAEKENNKTKAEGIIFAVEFIEKEDKRLDKLREYRRARRKNKTMHSTGPLQ